MSRKNKESEINVYKDQKVSSYKDIIYSCHEISVLGTETICLLLITSPAAGFVIPAIILIQELLPAPLGPSNPKISPEAKNQNVNIASEILIYINLFLQ
jgi:hypothetical protein